MRKKLWFAYLTAAALLACLPTENCACTPHVSVSKIYGSVVRADGSVVPRALLGADASLNESCTFEHHAYVVVDPPRVGDGSKVRSVLLYPGDPGRRCVRLVAYAGDAGASDSAVVTNLVLPFDRNRTSLDSLGVILRLP